MLNLYLMDLKLAVLYCVLLLCMDLIDAPLYNKIGKYIENINYGVSTEVKKYVWFNAHIWGL